MLYLLLFILVIFIIRNFIRGFRSSYNQNTNSRNGYRTRSKYEDVEEADFKEIESKTKAKKEE
ncbi:MAG: hypothetical protein IPM56_03710 [Ignavibacteriales bacterium]|nr:MAG: hypothetical protein IPM56_03710 [Ignavibacteriales bacterium]